MPQQGSHRRRRRPPASVAAACEMAQSAIQAVENLEHAYGIPAGKIAVTPMIGVNDTSSETFTPADVDTLTKYAAGNGLAGLHFWSLDRDTPCATTTTYASPTCNSVSGSWPTRLRLAEP
jgi:chitinase